MRNVTKKTDFSFSQTKFIIFQSNKREKFSRKDW